MSEPMAAYGAKRALSAYRESWTTSSCTSPLGHAAVWVAHGSLVLFALLAPAPLLWRALAS
jgi:hypothetical protein